MKDSATLTGYFESGLTNDVANNDEGDSEDEKFEEDLAGRNTTTEWVDKFILESRRKGGRTTENSVLKQWKVCHITCNNDLSFIQIMSSHGIPMSLLQDSFLMGLLTPTT